MKLANRIGAAVLATAMVGTLLTGCGCCFAKKLKRL